MIYMVPGRPGLVYEVGDRIETFNGISGIVVTRHRPYRGSSTKIVLDDGTEVSEHYINKVWRNGHEDWKKANEAP